MVEKIIYYIIYINYLSRKYKISKKKAISKIQSYFFATVIVFYKIVFYIFVNTKLGLIDKSRK